MPDGLRIFLSALAVIGLLGGHAAAQVADPVKWAEIQDKAKAEGEVDVSGPPNPGLRAGLGAAFKARYGIRLNYFGETTASIITRIDTEVKADRLTIDADIGGLSTCWVFAGRGEIEPMNGKLVDPALFAPGLWKHGHPTLGEMPVADPGPAAPKCAFELTEWVYTFLFANTAAVQPPIGSFKDLLEPRFKGKIVAFDPHSAGPGEPPVGYLGKVMGLDYVTALYIGQNLRFSADSRQLAEWVARGEYAVGIGLVPFAVEIYRRQGLPIAAVTPREGPGPLTGGFGLVMLLAKSPHPNAAQLFVNWLGSKEAMEIYEKNMMEPSLRTDVDTGTVPDYVVPRPGVTYPIYDQEYSYFTGERAAAVEAVKKGLAAR